MFAVGLIFGVLAVQIALVLGVLLWPKKVVSMKT